MTKQKKSTFRVLFYLKKNNPNKNGLAPIMGRITIDGKIAQFSTKLECDPKQWDLKFGRITGRSDEAVRINERLTGIRTQIDKHYYTMLREEGFASADKVKCAFLGINISSNMLLKLFAEQNAVMAQMVEAKTRSNCTYKNLTTVYSHLTNYISLKYKRGKSSARCPRTPSEVAPLSQNKTSPLYQNKNDPCQNTIRQGLFS